MSHDPRAPRTSRLRLAASALLAALPVVAAAQDVEGTVFHDLNGNGLRDVGEPAISAATIDIYTAGASVRRVHAGDTFRLATIGGCQAIDVLLPQAPDPATFANGTWRRSLPDQTWEPPPGTQPVGILRLSAPANLRANLSQPDLLHVSLGDSIAAGVSVCAAVGQDTNYIPDVAGDLRCLTTGTVTLDNRAIGGSESDDLLIPDGGRNMQYVGVVAQDQPDLVTISIGGNDFLRSEPATLDGQTHPYDPVELEESFRELIDVRRNLQEILSTLASEVPGADVELNTVYDNEAGDCDTTDFHAAGTALWNQVLRWLAFGQVRPAVVAEIQWELAHQDILRTACGGFSGQICGLDLTHPNAQGTLTIEEAVMESLGRFEVPVAGLQGLLLGYQELVATLHPTVATTIAGTVTASTDALTLDGKGAAVAFDGAILELSGFQLPAGVTPTSIVVGVRYRTTGTVADDRYRMDASVLDFAAPDFTFTGWDTVTPLAGSAGQPVHGGTARGVVNVLRNVAAWRDVSNTLTLNAIDDGRVTGAFAWPAPDADDVARLKVRITTEANGGADAAAVEIDGAWAFVHGTRIASVPVPGEVSGPGALPLLVSKEAAGVRVSWDAEPDSASYRLFEGAVGAFSAARVDPSADIGGCTDLLSHLDPDPGPAGGSRFYLVAGLNTDLEQGTLGWHGDGTPRSSGPALCP